MMIGSLIFSKESFALLVFDFLILMYLCSFALQFASDDSILKYFYFSFFLIQKGNTALHIASLAGHLNIVNLLVENGAKYDVQAHVSYHGNRSIDKS